MALYGTIEDIDEHWAPHHFMQEGYTMGCTCETDHGNPNEPTEMGLLQKHDIVVRQN